MKPLRVLGVLFVLFAAAMFLIAPAVGHESDGNTVPLVLGSIFLVTGILTYWSATKP